MCVKMNDIALLLLNKAMCVVQKSYIDRRWKLACISLCASLVLKQKLRKNYSFCIVFFICIYEPLR